jgi:hypothetical protein
MTTASARPSHSARFGPENASATADQHALQCADCGRVVPCSIDDIVRFADTAWPRCCGEVMSLDSPVGPSH